ncbi:S1 RNA-binding domain-containing protein [Candidatus Dependentiae bacterium]|nr:S1 RNA-binding domain-containing protein [Candidatus Dependentiae bacterium]
MSNANIDNNAFTSLEENGKSMMFNFMNEDNPDGTKKTDTEKSDFINKTASKKNENEISEENNFQNNVVEKEENVEAYKPDSEEKNISVSVNEAQKKNISNYEEFTLLFEDNLKDLKEKTVVTGKVILVTKEDVLVDIGAKSEGLISIEEFENNPPKVGDDIKVFIRRMESDEGGLELSYRIGKQIYAWQKIEELKAENKPITGKIIEIVKNGFIVDIGIPTFLHISQLGKHKITKPELYLNKSYEFKITDIDKEKKKVSLSRRQLIEEEEQKAAEIFFSSYKPGDILSGNIQKIMEFGAVISLGGVTGFLHITNVSWGFVDDINQLYKTGQEIQVKILDMDKETKKIGLGVKQLTVDPWETAETKYQKDKSVFGKIFKIDQKGITIKLEEGIMAFLPSREIAWIKDKKENFKIGDGITVKVIDFSREKKNIIVSLKQRKLNPWQFVKEKMANSEAVEGIISDIKPNFLIVQLQNGLMGIVPRKLVGWNEIDNLEKHFKIGNNIIVKIIEVIEESNKIVLSIKDTLKDPWMDEIKKLEKNKTFKCKVLKILKAGVIVRITDEYTGFIHISQLTEKNVKGPEDVVKQDEEITANISSIDYKTKKISLSVLDYLKEQEKKELQTYLKDQEDIDNSLGNFFKIEDF